MPRPLFLQGAREQRTHSRATPEPTPSAKGSIDPAFIAGGTLILLAGSSAEAVASVIEGRWAAAGACIVADILTLFFFGLLARRSHRKADARHPQPDEHEDLALWLGDVDPEYAAHQRAYAAMPDKHTPAAKRKFDAMQRCLHTRLAGRA